MMKKRNAIYVGLILAPLICIFLSLFIGRYPLSFATIVRVLGSRVMNNSSYYPDIYETIIWDIRLPRALLGALVGGCLGISGAAFQGLFRNPLVDSGILGVSSGAGFGAALAIILFNNVLMIYILSFIFGILAVFLSYLIGRIYNTTPTIMLVLGGVIVSSVFSSLVSLIKYVADPYNQLPTIVFWLMGSLATASYHDISRAILPMLVGITGLILIRWRINVLSMGDREAQALGINVKLSKGIVIACTTLATAGAVSVSGIIGWIGLVIPHIGRMLIGNDNKLLIPASFSLGACFLIVIDNIGRAITGSELPLSILTALVGGPFYVFLLKKTKGGGW
ncbi:FecCD family ABC transporter permease [Natronincola ferrireducens]|uniref:Iron complex transport system permease protein n=1 Tax=Natronincola ferrireducens TaxID=393762 RepID=A0A1G8ZP59_9FIRM|nr:iron ABC transporter permease [Natronincola ferrireducens]SDK16807.1 iron complex transport system permease protein [Natronincola ferrireducens]